MTAARILIIDDEPTIGEGCRIILSEQGHQVDVCRNGSQGLRQVLSGDYDILLLDMKLPDIDGMDILSKVRNNNLDTYILVMTGYSTVKNAVAAMKAGAFDYLAKPFSDEELLLALDRALDKKQLVEENRSLRQEVVNRGHFGHIVGETPQILEVFQKVEKVAATESTVLIYGESGTGKELFARAIHSRSQRALKPFVAVDCSTLSPNLLESELFGHVKGAFTGATRDKTGLFDQAQGGTFFMDDVANLSLSIQAKLLRILEAREYKAVGASRFKKTDARIIAATNQDLEVMVKEGSFRQDLYYRLNVVPIYLPPLRERKDDIPRLAYHFLQMFCRKTGKHIQGFSDEALEVLKNHPWPGNVRQLKNTIERLVILSDNHTLNLQDLLEQVAQKHAGPDQVVPSSLAELREFKKKLITDTFGRVERAFLIKALSKSGGNISRAAKLVGMQRSNFSTLLKKYGISAKELSRAQQ